MLSERKMNGIIKKTVFYSLLNFTYITKNSYSSGYNYIVYVKCIAVSSLPFKNEQECKKNPYENLTIEIMWEVSRLWKHLKAIGRALKLNQPINLIFNYVRKSLSSVSLSPSAPSPRKLSQIHFPGLLEAKKWYYIHNWMHQCFKK